MSVRWLLAGTALLILLTAFRPVHSAEWLSGYAYRVPIDIHSDANLSDYQVRVVFDSNTLISQGKLLPDCSDLRFTDDQNNVLPYWIESGCDTNETVVWVRVPEIHAGVTRIYMYYGNPSATSESNADAVFIFYDDFEQGTLDPAKWVVVQGNVYVQDGYLVLAGEGDITTRPVVRTAFQIPGDVEVVWSGYVAQNGGQLRMVYAWDGSSLHSSWRYPINCYIQNESGDLSKDVSGTITRLIDIDSTVVPGTQYTYIFRYEDGGQMYVWRSDAGSPDSGSVFDSTFPPRYMGFFGREQVWVTRYYAYVDYVYVRRYVSPEPTVSLGPEEPALIPTRLSLSVS